MKPEQKGRFAWDVAFCGGVARSVAEGRAVDAICVDFCKALGTVIESQSGLGWKGP